MYILAQHGWGKSDKIERGIRDKSLVGVMMSPKDERIEKFETFVSEFHPKFEEAKILMDPQFYHVPFQNSKDGNLGDYPYYPGYHNISAFRGSKNTRGFVKDVLLYQEERDFNYLTSPTIHISSFSSREAQITLDFAQESVDVRGENEFNKPLLISFAIHENAFLDKRLMENFLDELSMIEAHGIYLIISRNPTGYHQKYDDPSKLANILAFIYSLSEINQFEVIVGFADFCGMLYLAAGATHIATGWSQGLRRFTLDRIAPEITGGRRPRPRYSSGPLFNSILTSELDSILTSRLKNQFDQFLSQTTYDHLIRSNPLNPAWDEATSTLHHWMALENTAQSLFSGKDDVTERFDSMESAISNAIGLYTILDKAYVQFDSKSNSNHLEGWGDAIREFRLDASI
ncbi:hypothetical protein [Paenibacillus odorifer]|uniref:Uncharacterized protein n=1 Tax=Paenibacillus odorifer TaxID=189426 RepID=A0A1R0Y9S5_9BACL|nr:hypothetical protein [Paenibacillus odorifer]OMD44034.1 hypothetical protein BSK52_00340 [Paenibacillus odorifer]